MGGGGAEVRPSPPFAGLFAHMSLSRSQLELSLNPSRFFGHGIIQPKVSSCFKNVLVMERSPTNGERVVPPAGLRQESTKRVAQNTSARRPVLCRTVCAILESTFSGRWLHCEAADGRAAE